VKIGSKTSKLEMNEEAKRNLILQYLRWGKKPAEIQRITGASLSTIRSVNERQSADRAQRQNGKTIRTPELVVQVAQCIENAPRQTISGLSRDFQVAPTTMRRLVKEDLGSVSYVRPGAVVRRKERSQKLLNHLKNDHKGKVILFSDECYFTLAQYSLQNDKFIWRKGDQANAPHDLRYVGQKQRASGSMFLGIVASNGDIGPTIWVEPGVKINADAYLDLLKEKVKPWIDATFEPGTWVWQQDGAPAHTCKRVQDYLRNDGWTFWTKEEWPPSSPDLSPLDFSIWDHIKSESCRDPAPNLETMRWRVEDAWCAMDRSYVKKVCSRFRGRLEQVIAADGGRIED
jgi:hypothetical protein